MMKNIWYEYKIERMWSDEEMKNEELKGIIAEAILKSEEMRSANEDKKIKAAKVRLKTKLLAYPCIAVAIVGAIFGVLSFNIDTFFKSFVLSMILAMCGYTLIVMDKCRGTDWQITFLSLLISSVSLFISLID